MILLRKNLWNVVLLGLAITVFVVGAWQLDLVVSPLVWAQPNFMRDIAFGVIFFPNYLFYGLCFLALFLGIPLTFISVWWWSD